MNIYRLFFPELLRAYDQFPAHVGISAWNLGDRTSKSETPAYPEASVFSEVRNKAQFGSLFPNVKAQEQESQLPKYKEKLKAF